MPEGHTIHGLARRLSAAFAGRVVDVSSPQGRFAAEAAQIHESVLEGTEAVGKHLFIEMAGDHVVHVHLGLIGNFAVEPGPASQNPVVGTVRLRIADGAHTADLRGPQTCELVSSDAIDLTLARLGPDPLRPGADPERAWRRIHESRRTVAELLMDQSVVAGIGNVYRCELLFLHRVDPFLPGCELPHSVWDAIWVDLVRLLPLGMVFNQILTMPDQVAAAERDLHDPQIHADAAVLTGRRLGDRYERRFFLYQRTGEPCRVCGTTILSRKVTGRVLYWCPTCQAARPV